MHPVIPYVLAALLFGVGVYGLLVRRNVVLMLASVELMLGAANLVFITADVAPVSSGSGLSGQSFALFIIVIAAAEIGVGLALVLHLFRLRGNIDSNDIDIPESDPPDSAEASSDAPGDPRTDRAQEAV